MNMDMDSFVGIEVRCEGLERKGFGWRDGVFFGRLGGGWGIGGGGGGWGGDGIGVEVEVEGG